MNSIGQSSCSDSVLSMGVTVSSSPPSDFMVSSSAMFVTQYLCHNWFMRPVSAGITGGPIRLRVTGAWMFGFSSVGLMGGRSLKLTHEGLSIPFIVGLTKGSGAMWLVPVTQPGERTPQGSSKEDAKLLGHSTSVCHPWPRE